MSEVSMATVDVVASDVTGQRSKRVTEIPKSRTVSDLVQQLLARLGLATRDRDGNPLAYNARLDRERRQLHGGERVGDIQKDEDDVEITLLPRIDAGGC